MARKTLKKNSDGDTAISVSNYSITKMRKRLLAIFIAITFFICFCVCRVFYIQIIWGKDLQEKAIDQWTREIPVKAKRGEIFDTNGILLATNNDTYSVFVRKKAVENKEELCETLSKVLEIDYDYLYERLTKTVSSEVTVKKQVEKEKIDKLSTYNYSGVYFSRDNSRVYSYGDYLSSIIGITSNDGKGQSGLELYYDKYLRGEDGEILYETDIVGIETENSKASYLPSLDGLNVKLTIDYEIQQLCEVAMEEAMSSHNAKKANMIVIDPSNGEILALCTKPSYDLNNPNRDNLEELNKLSRNSIICDMYEPGSTFKILTAAANIEEYLNGNKNAYSLNHIFNSSRYRYVDGQKIKCWSNHQNGKHANLNLQGALNNSCNPIFVDIALALGKDTMYKYLNLFNYGTTLGIDFNGESQGMLLPKSSVLRVDLARISFGQTVAVTPLQLCYATASAINGGIYYTPYLVKEIYSNDGIIVQKSSPKIKNRTISEQSSKILASYLEDVVANGSGKQAFIEGYKVAGKTGVL